MLENNTLSIVLFTLGLLLLKGAFAGILAANKLSNSTSEEVKASRYSENTGFLLLAAYMKLAIIMFNVFLFCSIMFIFFNTGPAAWMENTYF